MNKGTIILTAIFFITGCLFYIASCFDEPVIQREIKKEIVHDTIVKYEKCLKSSRERLEEKLYHSDSTQLYEIFKRKTDERVFYIDAISLKRNILRNNGKLLTKKTEICSVAGDVLMCGFDFKIEKTIHTFIKEWPVKEYYFTYTQSTIPFGTRTVNYFPKPLK